MLSVWFQIMHCCIPTPTTDSNTSTGMIWVTLNMPSAAEECREPLGKCQRIWHCLESVHPVHYITVWICMKFCSGMEVCSRHCVWHFDGDFLTIGAKTWFFTWQCFSLAAIVSHSFTRWQHNCIGMMGKYFISLALSSLFLMEFLLLYHFL